jgi:hypothetical protein
VTNISVPPCERRDRDEGRRAAAALAELASRVRMVPDGDDVVFTVEGFLYPVAVAMLAALRADLLARNCRVDVRGFTDYLSKIRFPGLTAHHLTGRAMALQIHGEMRGEDFRRYVRAEWLAHILPAVLWEAGNYLEIALGEVYENAFIHSESPVGVALFGQFYPASKEYHFAIVDLGCGIPSKVAKFLGSDEQHADAAKAIKWAFERNNSTLPSARGSGLPILRTFATRNKGEIEVFSGGGHAVLGESPVFEKYPGHMAATCVNVILRNISYVVRPGESLLQ